MSAFAALWRKEMREVYLRGGASRAGLVLGLVMPAALGVAMPFIGAKLLAVGDVWMAAWFSASFAVGGAAFMGFLQPASTVMDSLAGERERHTMETLLATPVSDGAILGAKVLAQWMAVLASALLLGTAHLVTATLAFGQPGFVAGLAALALAPAVATLTASFLLGLGMAVSAKAPTIKHGQQILGYALTPIFMLLWFGPMFATPWLKEVLSPSGLLWLAVGVGTAVFVVANAAFWWLAARRCRRTRLLGN